MTGLSRRKLEFELDQLLLDLKAYRAAGTLVEKRLIASKEIQRHNNISTSAVGHSAQATLMLGVVFLERLVSDYQELIRQVEEGAIPNTDSEALN